MDSGILKKVGSVTPGDLFVGFSQIISCLRDECGFAEKIKILAWDKLSLRYGEISG